MSEGQLERVVVTTGGGTDDGPVDAAVIWLHGLGADGHDFEPIVPELGLPAEAKVRFVFPHARPRPVALNQGYVMRAWYDIKGMDVRRDEDETGIRASEAEVTQLIDEEIGRGTSANRIVVAGFSQGGAMAYHVGLRYPEALAGILVLSAYLLLEERIPDEAAAANQNVSILQCHGTHDPVVPIGMGERAAATLTEHGYAVDWRTYPVPHGLHPDEVRDLAQWLRGRLDL